MNQVVVSFLYSAVQINFEDDEFDDWLRFLMIWTFRICAQRNYMRKFLASASFPKGDRVLCYAQKLPTYHLVL